jgi:hypothetical protein
VAQSKRQQVTCSDSERPGDSRSICLLANEPGHYEVQIVQEPGQPLAQAEGSAEFRDHIAVLTVKLDLTRLSPGLYLMEIRQSGLSWSQNPVLLK